MNQTIAYINVTKVFDYAGLQYPILSNKYMQALILFIFFMVVANIIVYILKRYAKFLTRKTKTDLDDKLIEQTQQPIINILYILALEYSIMPLGISSIFYNVLHTILVILGTVIAVRVVDILLDELGRRIAKRTKSDIDDELIPLAHKASKVIVILIGFMFVLTIWGFEIGPLLASLGIAGIAIAFALQSALGNIVGGISLILDKTFKRGDLVALETGEMGQIHDVGLRSTNILNFDGELINVPNGALSNMKITNWTDPYPPVRFTVNFGVVYGSDIEKVKKTAMKAINKVEKVSKDPEPHVYFNEMADFSLNFAARCWVDDFNDRYYTKEEVTTEIYNAMKKAGIEFAFPTSTIYLNREE